MAKAFRNEKLKLMICKGKDEKGEPIMRKLSPRIVGYSMAVLRSALGTALKRGHVRQNVAKLVDTPKQTKSIGNALTRDQAKVFRDAVAGNLLEALFLVASRSVCSRVRYSRSSGMRSTSRKERSR